MAHRRMPPGGDKGMSVLTWIGKTAIGRLTASLMVAAAGLAVATGVDSGDIGASSPYMWGVSVLLALGLYGSASGIPRSAVTDLRLVLAAVTVGVLLKTALIAGVMYLVSGDRAAVLLGVAVAQIDPLSVAAIRGRSRMSPRAKSLLLAWASFDDPVTALLTVYLMMFALDGDVAPGGGIDSWALGLLMNLLFAAVAWVVWTLVRRGRNRPATREPSPTVQIVAAAVLVGLMFFAAWQFLMLGIALIGLFFRPGLDAWMEKAIDAAYFLATFALGMLLAGGVDLKLGVVLGAAAFAAQIVAALLIARRLPTRDRVHLALAQQNGITAVILALLLAPRLPYAVSVVAPAILTVNVLNIVSNAVWDRWESARTRFRPTFAEALENVETVESGEAGETGETHRQPAEPDRPHRPPSRKGTWSPVSSPADMTTWT
ncbi:hypothetical protein AB0K60_04770 [Thermopolyspora sp. NPDC052614]|uniref:hypothetical protein n=1 Tax=Thermopolyspora sp. NPDC052614 TaxID=3155682 RepID=UPI003417BEA8